MNQETKAPKHATCQVTMTVEDKLAPAKESSEVVTLAGKRHSTVSSSLRQAKIPTLPRWTNIHFCSARDGLETLRQTRKSSTINCLGFNQNYPASRSEGTWESDQLWAHSQPYPSPPCRKKSYASQSHVLTGVSSVWLPGKGMAWSCSNSP